MQSNQNHKNEHEGLPAIPVACVGFCFLFLLVNIVA